MPAYSGWPRKNADKQVFVCFIFFAPVHTVTDVAGSRDNADQ